MKSLLVPVDLSRTTPRTVEHAAQMAADTSAQLCLLYVAPPEADFAGHQLGRKVVEEPVPEELREEWDRLAETVHDLRERGIDAESLMVRGKAVDCILEEAGRLGADLIVMGSHGHGALYRSVVGSVSEGVLRSTSCPVLIVPRVQGG
jgi:nucleotide-binding universal stress UspA family protein